MGNDSTTLASDSMARYGAYLAIVLGFALMVIGGYTFFAATSTPLAAGLFLVGAIEVLASIFTIMRKRIAWAFAVSTNATLALTFLFGAPRVRDSAGVAIELALVPSLAFLIAAIFFIVAESEFSGTR